MLDRIWIIESEKKTVLMTVLIGTNTRALYSSQHITFNEARNIMTNVAHGRATSVKTNYVLYSIRTDNIA